MNEITDHGDPKKYWTQIPNIVYTLALSPFELTLYNHLKWAAGASPKGRCRKSNATLAKETRMGAGTVSRAKTELEKPRSELNDKPLIITRHIPNPRGGKAFQEIAITDIWKVNILCFTSSPLEIETEQVPEKAKPSSRAISTGEINKNSKQEHEQEDALAKYKSDPLYGHVDVEREFQKASRWADVHRKKVTPKFFVNWLNRIDAPFRPNGNGRTYVDDEWDKAKTMDEIRAMVEA